MTITTGSIATAQPDFRNHSLFKHTDRYLLINSSSLSSTITSSAIYSDGCSALAIEIKLTDHVNMNRMTGSLSLAQSVSGLHFTDIVANSIYPSSVQSVSGTVINGVETTNGIVHYEIIPPTMDYQVRWTPKTNSSGSISAWVKKIFI